MIADLDLTSRSAPAQNLVRFLLKAVAQTAAAEFDLYAVAENSASYRSAIASVDADRVFDWLVNQIVEPGIYLIRANLQTSGSFHYANASYETVKEIANAIDIAYERKAIKELSAEPKRTKIYGLARVAGGCHALAVEKGWWEGMRKGPDSPVEPKLAEKVIPEKLALIHAEVSEALEVYRNTPAGGCLTSHVDVDPAVSGVAKPVGFDSELADVVIRVFDLAGALGIDIEKAILAKHAYNKARSYRHGGKRA